MIDVGDCVRSHERHDENMEMSKDKRPESGVSIQIKDSKKDVSILEQSIFFGFFFQFCFALMR